MNENYLKEALEWAKAAEVSVRDKYELSLIAYHKGYVNASCDQLKRIEELEIENKHLSICLTSLIKEIAIIKSPR